MSFFDRLVDHSPELRCSGIEALARVTTKGYVGDAGFGDCRMQIEYEFHDASGQPVRGKYLGTESNFFGINVGDEILVRYIESNTKKNVPRDALAIITPVTKAPCP